MYLLKLLISVMLVCQLQILGVCGQDEQQFTLEILAHHYQHSQETCCRSNCMDCVYSFEFCVGDLDESSSGGSCSYGSYEFEHTASSTRLDLEEILPEEDVPNPMVFKSESEPWPGGFRLRVTVEVRGGSQRSTISEEISVTITAPQTGDIIIPEQLDGDARISLSYTLTCTEHYYGPNCAVNCIPRDDDLGHYTCDSSTGDRVCLPGYTDPSNNCIQVSTQPTDSTVPPTVRATHPPTTQATTTLAAASTAATTAATTDQVDANACPTLPCLNEGKCVGRAAGNALCECEGTGYQGAQCEIPVSTAPPTQGSPSTAITYTDLTQGSASTVASTEGSPTTTASLSDSPGLTTDPNIQTVAGGAAQTIQLTEGSVAGLVIGVLLALLILALVCVGVGVIIWRWKARDGYKLDPVKAKQSLDNPNYEAVELKANPSTSSPTSVYTRSQFTHSSSIERTLDNDNPLYFSTALEASADYAIPPDAMTENIYDLPPDEQGYPLPPSQPPPPAPTTSGLFDNPDYADSTTMDPH